MKLTGPEAMPPPDILALEQRMVDRFTPAPEPYLNSMASVLARSMIEPMLSWTELMKHAEHCGFCLDPDVEPDRRVERHLLVDEEVRQLGLERGQVLVGREVALGLGPGGDRVDDAVDELLDAVLALRRADVAAEVLADHDVGGELAPEAGTSTSFCSKTLLPVSELMPAVRYSQVISSYGWTPGRVQRRSNVRPRVPSPVKLAPYVPPSPLRVFAPCALGAATFTRFGVVVGSITGTTSRAWVMSFRLLHSRSLAGPRWAPADLPTRGHGMG